MLLQSQESLLLVVDIQEKLLPSIVNGKQLVANTCWLIELAKELNIPYVVSEQYPKGLGPTVTDIKEATDTSIYLEKTCFSVCADNSCYQSIAKSGRKQLILVGIETPICVMQSAIEFKQKGFDVFVVADCVSGRHLFDHEAALERMRQVGIVIISKEMVLFEWLRDAKHEKFKAISQKFLKG